MCIYIYIYIMIITIIVIIMIMMIMIIIIIIQCIMLNVYILGTDCAPIARAFGRSLCVRLCIIWAFFRLISGLTEMNV